MDSVLIQDIHMHIPDTDIYIYVGDVCTVPNLGSGNYTAWYGWYTPENSHPVYGWFFLNEAGTEVYPIKFKYFDGLQVVEHHDPSGGMGVMPYESGASYQKGQLIYLTTGEIYQAEDDFTAADTGDTAADFAFDIASGNLVPVGEDVLPIATTSTLGGIIVGDHLTITNEGTLSVSVDDAFNAQSTNPVQNATLTELFTPMTQAEYDLLDNKTMPLYFIYEA